MTTINNESLYLHYGYMSLPKGDSKNSPSSKALLGTFLSNMAYYGYVPSTKVMSFLQTASAQSLKSLWKTLEVSLKNNSGAGRDMGKYVVYKNFPTEVLEMSDAEYWIKQILMYIGLPNELFTEEEESRDAMFENVTMKVLHAVSDNTLYEIFNKLLALPTRWTTTQQEHVNYLLTLVGKNISTTLDMKSVGFKENGINAIVFARNNVDVPLTVAISDATDVLRLAAGLSDGDVSLRTHSNYKKFKRSERRELLSLLENSNNLEDDMATRPNEFKKLLMGLHPGDYSFTRVSAAYDALYNNKLKSFASKVDLENIRDLTLLSTRPGEFLRRFHAVYNIFKKEAVDSFIEVMPKLSTQQLVKICKYLETINTRTTLMYPPRGNWARVKIVDNNKTKIDKAHLDLLLDYINFILNTRLAEILPEGVALDRSADLVKLQTNDQKLASYGRGTAFPIPDNIKFIRAASYWGNAASRNSSNVWMDNGFNFFDESWEPMGTICWNSRSWSDMAVFSGDPTNSKTADGKACQVIDLYLDKLQCKGVRYIVWNILSYNSLPFDDVDDVFASLQWGEDAFTGAIYEPSRAQMEFKITGANMTKYIAYIDLVERKLVYMDANLKGNVHSASYNGSTLRNTMPSFVEYLNSLPSVYDLFKSASSGSVPVTFSDANMEITGGKAYVFRPENPDNTFTKLDLNTVLS